MTNKTETFLEYKALLFSIAYNMLGGIDAAEDIVQDTYLKWMETDAGNVRQTKAFLVKIVTNQCINYLNSARVQREKYIGVWLPEPLRNYDPSRDQSRIETYHALSIGMLVLMERLTPQERAVFLLKEIFAYDYFELAEIFDKSTDSCRQLLKRAKDNLGKETRRFEVDMHVHQKMLRNFLQAVAEGDLDGLIGLLKEDIQLFADGGGRKAIVVDNKRLSAFPKPINGSRNVINAMLRTFPRFLSALPELHVELAFANGLPSVISYSGDEPVGIISIETDGERIRNIYLQTNPDKLKHIKKAL
jgi:RNA polymerase sigma-70 factor, ECF subfamily